jgi:hypothetical protein
MSPWVWQNREIQVQSMWYDRQIHPHSIWELWDAAFTSSWIWDRWKWMDSMSLAGQKGHTWSYRSTATQHSTHVEEPQLADQHHGAFNNSCFTSGESHCPLVKTHPCEAVSIQKWCDCDFLHAKILVQLQVWTTVHISSLDTSWAGSHSADILTTSCKLPTFALLYWSLYTKKHQYRIYYNRLRLNS